MKNHSLSHIALIVFFALFCVKLVFPVTAPPFLLAIYDKSPGTDVLHGTQIMSGLVSRGFTNLNMDGVLFSEVDALDIDNQVTLAICNGEAIIIQGIDVRNAGSIIDETTELLSQKDIPYSEMDSSELTSSSLLDLFDVEDDSEETDEDAENESVSDDPDDITQTPETGSEPDAENSDAPADVPEEPEENRAEEPPRNVFQKIIRWFVGLFR